MDLLFSVTHDDEVVAQSFLEYKGESQYTFPLTIAILSTIESLDPQECTSELERIVLGLRAIDCYPTSYNDDIDYDRVNNFTPLESDYELDGSGETYIEDDIDCTGADCCLDINANELTAQILLNIDDKDEFLANHEDAEYSIDECDEEDREIFDLLLSKEYFTLEEIKKIYEVLKPYNAFDVDGYAIEHQGKIISGVIENNY